MELLSREESAHHAALPLGDFLAAEAGATNVDPEFRVAVDCGRDVSTLVA